MTIEIIVLALIFVKVSGGKIGNIKNFKYNKGYIAIIGILLYIFSLLATSKYYVKGISEIFFNYFALFHILSMVLIFISLIFNIKSKGIKYIALGMFLNIVPVFFNGYMPVSLSALLNTGDVAKIDLLVGNGSLTHRIVEDCSFYYLSDIIPIPRPYFYPRVISVGDIIISLGLFIAIYSFCKVDHKVDEENL